MTWNVCACGCARDDAYGVQGGACPLHHTHPSPPRAVDVQDVPQVVFLMSGGQLAVCNIGTFAEEQPHARLVKAATAPPPVPFVVAAAEPAPPSSPPGSDLQVFQDSADAIVSHPLPHVRSSRNCLTVLG